MVRPNAPETTPVGRFPVVGTEWTEIERELQGLKSLDFDGRSGRLPSYMYFHTEELLEVQKKAYSEYILENGLGIGTAFGSLEYMQNAIFQWAYELFQAPSTAGATYTSGGSISVLEAVRTARNRAREERGEPYGIYNVVAPFSAHPCLTKAGALLDVEVRRTPLGDEYRGDPKAIAAEIDENTIMIYGSAPGYPFGVFDPIERFGELALERNLWLHVDACWGGFLSPFAKQLGYPIPSWDFEVPGVTSLSADLHKHGYAVKGASLLLFRDASVQKYQEFVFKDWHRGMYVTPSLSGSSPGGSIAAAYAVMKFLGLSGYMEIAKATMAATHDWISGVNAIEGLRCFEPAGESSIFGFYSIDPSVDILAVAEFLRNRGWLPGLNTDPYAIQQAVTAVHGPFIQEYLSDLGDAVAEVRKTAAKGHFVERTY